MIGQWFFKSTKKRKFEIPEELEKATTVISEFLEKDPTLGIKFFEYWQSRGLSVLPNHFYSPVPDVTEMHESAWRPSGLVGIDQNIETQLDLLKKFSTSYREEYDSYPQERISKTKFFHGNPLFVGSDPRLLHSFIRHFQPEKILEIGSGYSTLLSNEALELNKKGYIESVDPYPQEFLNTSNLKSFKGNIAKKVQDLPYSFFEDLGENDILFIDSSHCVVIGGDVPYLYLEIIPRLKPGVLVHIHDICLPYSYPKNWVEERKMLWNESFMLQSFLTGNKNFEILFGSFLLGQYVDQSETVDRSSIDERLLGGGSFWMRCVK